MQFLGDADHETYPHEIDQTYLSIAYEFVANGHNSLGITEPLATKVTRFTRAPDW